MADEEVATVNSEMRYITLELMKIAAEKRQPFKKVAGEFIKNAHLLSRMIRENGRKKVKSGSTTAFHKKN